LYPAGVPSPSPSPKPEPSQVPPIESIRADAVKRADVLLETAAALRAELRGFETAIRKVRRYVGDGSSTQEMQDLVDMAAVRETLTRAATDFEVARHEARLTVWQLQRAEGMSVGAIARGWRLSRQLVSRTLKEAEPRDSGAS
jgi:hypothetical protein